MLTVFCEFVAIVFNICLMIFIFGGVIKGNTKSVYIVISVFFIFFVIPIILDFTIGVPDYSRFPGFYYSSLDSHTRTIYAIYVIIAPIIIMVCSKSKSIEKNNINISSIYKYRTFIYLIIFSPLIVLLFSPEPLSYLTYGAYVRGMLGEAGREYHSYLTLATNLSIIFTVLLIFVKPKNALLALILLAPVVLFDFWIHGKRNIVALFLLAIMFVVWKRRLISKKKIFVLSLIAIISLISFSGLYMDSVKGKSDQEFNEDYLGFRIDYGRDDVTRLTIYNEVNEDISILEFRGQSLLFYLTTYVPRSLWPDKPYPYAQYLTSALFFSEPKLWGWGMTTSILEEMIANLSWLGMFVGPFIVGSIIKLGENSRNEFFSLLSILLAILLLTVHLVAIFPIFLLWLVLLMNHIMKKIKIKFTL